MGTVSHHRTRALASLERADRLIADNAPRIPGCRRSARGESQDAAEALRRAATHITTALAVHQDCKHNSHRRLEYVLHANIAYDALSRSHLKTFRQVNLLPGLLDPARPPPPRAGSPRRWRHNQLRRMRRRVASMISDTTLLIEGVPRPVKHHKLALREPDLPPPPYFSHVRDILQLPNFLEIRNRYRLNSAAMDTEPDPHGMYARGQDPRRCTCHAHLWNRRKNPNYIILSPLWRRALEKTFRMRLPPNLKLPC